jgi:hypothetical protein
MTNKRTQILEDASRLISGDREAAYGPPAENFERVAAGWRVILGADVTPSQVALCLAWLKTARLVNTPTHEDSFVDMAGYAALAGELAE